MEVKEIVKSIKQIEQACNVPLKKTDKSSGNWAHQFENKVDYEKFYERVMGLVELADELTKPKGGGPVC